MTRALSKAQAIRVRLGGSTAMQDRLPPKPKRIRWKTYRLLRAKANGFWLESLSAGLKSSDRALGNGTDMGV